MDNTLRFNTDRLKHRKVDELLGICAGIAADGVVNMEEAAFILSWLEANREAATCFPGDLLVARLQDMLVDGALSIEESAELMQLLRDFSGMKGSPKIPSSAEGELFDAPAPDVTFPGKAFVMTGLFAYGPRVACEQATQARGGIAQPRVTNATDYVVVGTAASRDWKHASFGTKIERALALKKEGCPIAIISEDHWAEAIVSMPERPNVPLRKGNSHLEDLLVGKRFLFTGTLYGVSRATAQDWVERLGGTVVSSISTKLDYVVCGQDPGPKLEKALSMGIRILDRDTFLRMVGRSGASVQPSNEDIAQAGWLFTIRLTGES